MRWMTPELGDWDWRDWSWESKSEVGSSELAEIGRRRSGMRRRTIGDSVKAIFGCGCGGEQGCTGVLFEAPYYKGFALC